MFGNLYFLYQLPAAQIEAIQYKENKSKGLTINCLSIKFTDRVPTKVDTDQGILHFRYETLYINPNHSGGKSKRFFPGEGREGVGFGLDSLLIHYL